MKLLIYLTVISWLGNGCASTSSHGRCCSSDKGHDGGSCETDFSPQITKNIKWYMQDVNCSAYEKIVYYDVNNGSAYDNNYVHFEGNRSMFVYELRGLLPKVTEEYCIETYEKRYRGAVCQPDPRKICNGAPCIPKCCGYGEVLKDFQCAKGTGDMTLKFHLLNGALVSAPQGVIMVGDMIPDCGDKITSLDKDISKLQLLITGKLLNKNTFTTYEIDQYCIEDLYIDNDHMPLYITCNESVRTAIIVKRYLQKIGYVVSTLFLIIIVLLHIFIPSLRDTQGLCLVSHVVSMAVTFIFLFIISQLSYGVPHWFCTFCGIVLQYSLLAMFFWLNIMCFDIWRVIRETAKAVPLRGILIDDARKMKFYCLYGWCSPLVIVIITSIIHSLPEKSTGNITTPGFGRKTCWLNGDKDLFIYCHVYIIALFILDLIFLGHTMSTLIRLGGSCTMCFGERPSLMAFNRKHLAAFWQRFSLFILMVLCWVTEILSWKIPPGELWIISDFLNSLQGFLVFGIFVSNKKRRNLIRDILKQINFPCSRLRSETTVLSGTPITSLIIYTPSGSLSGPSTSEGQISQEQ